MRIEYKTTRNQIVNEPIEDFVASSFDGSDYGRGQIETIAAEVRNQGLFLGRLMNHLVETSTINFEQFKEIVQAPDALQFLQNNDDQ